MNEEQEIEYEKIYDICGIGNAIVDVVVDVKDEFLIDQGIVKGQMTLIDDDRAKDLIKAIDHTNAQMICGGSVANSLNLASRLGSKCFFQGLLADDDPGHVFIQDLKQNNIFTQVEVLQKRTGHTGQCIVMVSPDGERTMCTNIGIAGELTDKSLYTRGLKESRYLYLEGYLVTSQNGLKAMCYALTKAKQHQNKVILTFSDPSMPLYFREELQSIVNLGIDILFCNEEEACLFTGEKTLDASINVLQDKIETVVVTMGDQGATVIQGGHQFRVEGLKSTCIDTNGAGDAFAGAFIHGIASGQSVEEALKIANRYGAKVVGQSGARLLEI